jgi:FKBP-type peptidyl-prolyl cis-trans isomerase 2
MSEARTGDTVKVHYTGTLDDGTQFDSSAGREPLAFILGSGQVIGGFDAAVAGMSVGDVKTVTIPAADAYGAHDPQRVQQVPRAAIPPEIELHPGLMLSAQGPNGQALSFKVTAFDDEQVTVDGNHPLAGQDLTFALELVEIA